MKRLLLLLTVVSAAWLTGLSAPHPATADEAPGTGVATEESRDAAAVAENLPAAREVVDRYVEAIGGRDAVLAHTSRTLLGKLSMPGQGIEGPLRMVALAPDNILLEIQIPGLGEMSTGYDGTVGWVIQPMTGPMLLEGDSLNDLRTEADFYDVLKDEANYDVMETVGEEAVDEIACWKVRFVRKGSERESFEFYDKETGMAVAIDAEQATPMGVVTVRTRIEGHGEFGGVLYPTRMSQALMGMDQVFIFESASFEPVDASVFAPPTEIQVLLEDAPAGN